MLSWKKEELVIRQLDIQKFLLSEIGAPLQVRKNGKKKKKTKKKYPIAMADTRSRTSKSGSRGLISYLSDGGKVNSESALGIKKHGRIWKKISGP